MTHWPMQVHPGEPSRSVRHAVESLSAGYIGLDFEEDTGDLTTIPKDSLPKTRLDYWAFAHEMKEGDPVLVIAHHFPLALARVAGPYNYIRLKAPEIGVWFRHFRAVDDVRYFADFKTNAKEWSQITMTDTISPLRDPNSLSYRLIQEWLAAHT